MKLILTIIFSLITLQASNNSNYIRVEILKNILSNISIEKKIKIWTDNKDISTILTKDDNYTIVKDCQDSNIIILEDKDKLSDNCRDKNIFVLNYQLLEELPQSFGALFWKKGRPNIVIIEPRANDRSIIVSQKLDLYLEDKVW